MDASTLAPGTAASWQQYQRMRARLAALMSRELTQQTGLSESDFEVLCALAESSATSVRAMELRCGLEWEKSRLSHQLRRMQQRGLVDRAGCDDDGRASMVQITAVGRDLLGRAREVNDALVQRYVVETLGASRLDALGEIAGLVLAALDDETGPTHH